MSLIQNDLKGYIIGNNQFNFQDARVDGINDVRGINDAANVISRTQGQQGIEIRNNRLVLSNGGYYETGAVFEDVGNEYTIDNTTKLYTYNVSNTPQQYLDWMAAGNPANVWIMGSNGNTEFEVELEGSFTVAGTSADFVLSDGDISLNDYGINVIDVDLSNMTFYIRKDSNNEDDLTLTEIAVYLPGSDPVQWPADLVDIDGIYDAIVDKLINDGYIQSQS